MARSQKRINRVVSVDLKPQTFRSGKVGAVVTYIAIIKNLGSVAETWGIGAWVEPQTTPGVKVSVPTPNITLFSQHAIRYEITISVGKGAVAGQEVSIHFELRNDGVLVLAVDRYFTVEPSAKRPR